MHNTPTGELDSLLPSLKEAVNELYHKLFGVAAEPVKYHSPATRHRQHYHSYQTASGNHAIVFACYCPLTILGAIEMFVTTPIQPC